MTDLGPLRPLLDASYDRTAGALGALEELRDEIAKLLDSAEPEARPATVGFRLAGDEGDSVQPWQVYTREFGDLPSARQALTLARAQDPDALPMSIVRAITTYTVVETEEAPTHGDEH